MTSRNNFHCKKYHTGFTLLELILVITLISILYAASLTYYQRTLDDAKRTGVEVLAHRFTAAVALVRAQWIVESSVQIGGKVPRTYRVVVDDTPIFLNANGWPANTDGRRAGINDQTADECYQVWMAVLQNPAPATVSTNAKSELSVGKVKGDQRYHISSLNRQICRFELMTNPIGTHYFDYNLKNGRVSVTVPPLK